MRDLGAVYSNIDREWRADRLGYWEMEKLLSYLQGFAREAGRRGELELAGKFSELRSALVKELVRQDLRTLRRPAVSAQDPRWSLIGTQNIESQHQYSRQSIP